ncbi:MAG: hypothetical protein AVDCRST_MAG53-1266, partial [uncultured Solirubrobacteraceae bacterium]
ANPVGGGARGDGGRPRARPGDERVRSGAGLLRVGAGRAARSGIPGAPPTVATL